MVERTTVSDITMLIEYALSFVRTYLDPVINPGSYSIGFLLELVSASFEGQLSIFRIVEEIGYLEGMAGHNTQTKPATMFTGKELYGYWHKHHSQPAHMPINLCHEMARDNTVERVWAHCMAKFLRRPWSISLSHRLFEKII